MSRFATRRGKLRSLLKSRDADAILVSSPTNVSYLSGFTGEDSFLLVGRTKDVLISDSRFVEQLKEECRDLEIHIRGVTQTQADGIGEVIGRSKHKRVILEAQSTTLAQFEAWRAAIAGAELQSHSGLVEGLREIKDKEEIAAIRLAIETAERAMGAVRATLRDEQSEREIAAEIEHWIRKFGGQGCSFKPIIAAGPRAALPHAPPSSQSLGHQDFVLMDWGARIGGYVSDLTRVWGRAKIPPKLERIHGIVLNAQRRAIEKVRPGALAQDVDAAARSVIEQAGYGRNFGHGLGHGIGMDVHEAPRLAPKQAKPLKAGMVITIEPGIYLPDWGGVRIEDDVLVTRDGHEVLSSIETRLTPGSAT